MLTVGQGWEEGKTSVPWNGTDPCSVARTRTRVTGVGASAERPGIEVLNRAVDILDAFTVAPTPSLRLSELAERTGLPKATLHRLLAALEVLGLVERTGSGHQLGIRLFELGEHVPRKERLREAAQPFMQDLFEVSHDTVHLAVLEGTDVVYLERIRGHRSAPISSRVGGRLPAYCTGVGKAMLAFAPEAAMSVLAGPLERRTAYTIIDHQLFAEELNGIRQSGLSFDHEENQIGVNCVAAPILLSGRPIAAVSITSTSSRVEVERFASAVKAAALGIQRVVAKSPGIVLEPRTRRARKK